MMKLFELCIKVLRENLYDIHEFENLHFLSKEILVDIFKEDKLMVTRDGRARYHEILKMKQNLEILFEVLKAKNDAIDFETYLPLCYDKNFLTVLVMGCSKFDRIQGKLHSALIYDYQTYVYLITFYVHSKLLLHKTLSNKYLIIFYVLEFTFDIKSMNPKFFMRNHMY